jgi:hypothetical protein
LWKKGLFLSLNKILFDLLKLSDMLQKFILCLAFGFLFVTYSSAQRNDSLPFFTENLILSESLNTKNLKGVKLEGKQIQAQKGYKFIQNTGLSAGKEESWFVLVPADFSGKTFNASQLTVGNRNGKVSLAPGNKAKIITCCCSSKPPKLSSSAISLNCAPGCKPCDSGKAGSRYHILIPLYR